MRIFLWYLLPGTLTLLVFVTAYFIKRKTNIYYIKDRVMEALHPKQKQNRLLFFTEDVLAPALAGLLVLLFWPIFLIVQAKAFLADRRSTERINKLELEPVFKPESDDLIEKLSLAEIEQRSIIYDPLKAVPPHPFGHLNSAWQKFLSQVPPDSELWRFEAWNKTRFGMPERLFGYAAVRDGTIGAHFVYGKKLTHLLEAKNPESC